jgi:hypothetical protein
MTYTEHSEQAWWYGRLNCDFFWGVICFGLGTWNHWDFIILYCFDSVFGLNDVIRSPSYTPPSPPHTHSTTQHNTPRFTTQNRHNGVQLNTFWTYTRIELVNEARDLLTRNMIFYSNLGRVCGCRGKVSVSWLFSVKIRDGASKLFMSTTFQIITQEEFFVAFTSRRFSGGFSSTDRKPLVRESGVWR